MASEAVRPGRVDSRGLHEAGLPPVAADQEVREGLLGGGVARPDAIAPGAELIRLEAGQPPADLANLKADLTWRLVAAMAAIVAILRFVG